MNLKRSIRNIICSFIWSRGLRHIIRDGYIKQYIKKYKTIKRDIEEESKRKFKYQLSFAIAIKNESLYIEEWIEYHRIVGVEKFYIYNNESNDNIKEILKPYIEKGIVEYKEWKGKDEQRNIYNDVIEKYKYESKWIGFIDADEFVVPVKANTILEVLKDYENYAGLSIHWLIYGNNNKTKKEEGLVIERFTKRAKDDFIRNKEIKSIVNPRFIVGMDIHKPYVYKKYYSVDEKYRKIYSHKNNPLTKEKIRINHYYCKSTEEFKLKQNRGDGFNTENKYDMSSFNFNNRNDIEDRIMDKYIDKLKERLKWKK